MHIEEEILWRLLYLLICIESSTIVKNWREISLPTQTSRHSSPCRLTATSIKNKLPWHLCPASHMRRIMPKLIVRTIFRGVVYILNWVYCIVLAHLGWLLIVSAKNPLLVYLHGAYSASDAYQMRSTCVLLSCLATTRTYRPPVSMWSKPGDTSQVV